MDSIITDILEIVNKEAELKKKGVISVMSVINPTAHLTVDTFRKLFPDVKPAYTDQYTTSYYNFDQLWSIEVGGVEFMALSESGEN